MKRLIALAGFAAASAALAFGFVLIASHDAQADGKRQTTRLKGAQEVPFVSTKGQGRFRHRVNHGEEIAFELRYRLEGDILQAHIHIGQKGANGCVAVFLCTNLENGPPGTRTCPPSPGEVSGVITAEDVVDCSAQGIAAGEFDELLKAIRKKAAYVNVHSSLIPSGELRGQIGHKDRRDGNDDDD